ncbi:hypothetical protein [Rhizorhabdus wittichii]|uniref:hypothetical protein n=1 Tax=Rhizorhabdus wittichii TaxID=160791 RepID=UPI00035DB013|nr:hypothetical protein [Rhizorhabdus wittichii]
MPTAFRTAENERAAIVAWLRADARKTVADLRLLHHRKKLSPGQTGEWEMLIGLKVAMATAIERGDHLKAREG